MDLNKTLSCPTGILSIGEGKKLIAFTLAEVLITLGIIGVVAAMTIPNLITAHQKKVTVTKLQKAVSVINQAYRMAYDDVGEPTPEEIRDMGTEDYIKTYWAPYMKISSYCYKPEECGYNSDSPFYQPNGINKQGSTMFAKNKGRFAITSPDGYAYFIITSGYSAETGDFTSVTKAIYLDINGGKGPNRMGRDVFMLDRVIESDLGKSGVVLPAGYDESNDTINQKCTKTGGNYCAERIRRAGWQIDKSYPW